MLIYVNMLVIGITSRALFDLDESHAVYEDEGLEAYKDFQVANEHIPLNPGQAFPLVNKLLALNQKINKDKKVEVILLSRNTADTGLRVFNSIQHHGLDIKRAAFCGGGSPHTYAKSFGAQLFLSTEFSDCNSSIQNGVAAARIIPSGKTDKNNELLKVAFDGDSVIFSEESQTIFDSKGLEAFDENERNLANKPLLGGPFKPFLSQLYNIQQEFPYEDCPIRIALVTARSAPSHERVILTLREWNIRIDECLFLGGLPKVNFLKAYHADIFFDDQKENCDLASEEVPTGHVVRLKHNN